MTEPNVNAIMFPGVKFTPEQIQAMHPMTVRLFESERQVAELRAQLAERDATITGDGNLENQYLFQIAELRGRVAKHKATIAECDATIAELRAQVATLTERLSRCTCTDDYGDVT